jgi:hypothetical protein
VRTISVFVSGSIPRIISSANGHHHLLLAVQDHQHRVLRRAFDTGHLTQVAMLLVAHDHADELFGVPALVAAIGEQTGRCDRSSRPTRIDALCGSWKSSNFTRISRPFIVELAEEERHLLPFDVHEQRARVDQVLQVAVLQVHGEFALVAPRFAQFADAMEALQIHGGNYIR